MPPKTKRFQELRSAEVSRVYQWRVQMSSPQLPHSARGVMSNPHSSRAERNFTSLGFKFETKIGFELL
jgi:hypothetical protein